MHRSTSQMLFRYYCAQRLINALIVQVDFAIFRLLDKSGVMISQDEIRDKSIAVATWTFDRCPADIRWWHAPRAPASMIDNCSLHARWLALDTGFFGTQRSPWTQCSM